MILKTSTTEEKNSQLRTVVNSFTGGDGLATKYMKQLKDRKVPDGKILGVHKYSLKNCNTYIVAIKRNYGRSRKVSELVFDYYAEQINPATGRVSYLRPSFDITGVRIDGYLEFTEHFIKRLKERDGKDFQDLLKTAGGDVLSLVDGTSGDLEGTFGGYRVFVKKEGRNCTITTMVTDDMLYDNQRPTSEVINVQAEQYNELKNSVIVAA